MPELSLSAEQMRDLMASVERGQLPDPTLKDVLFPPEKREVSLVYADKMRREDVIANTLAVPFQPVRCFAPEGSGADCEVETEWHNRLIWGDNLQAMKALLELKRSGNLKNADGSDGIRLIYIDPPFATQQEFRGNQDQKAYADKIAGAKFVEAMRRRLIMMNELLSDDGVLYLHLDNHKLHYLKLAMDEIFGEENFRSEIVWQRISAKNDSLQGAKGFPMNYESILVYSKSANFIWHQPYVELNQDYKRNFYKYEEPETGRVYQLGDLTAPGRGTRGHPEYEFLGVKRFWRYNQDKMQKLYDEGKIVQSSPNSVPRIKRYLDENLGQPVQAIWTDISPVQGQAVERVGYPTQKPEALLERIIFASSNPGDIVMDAFSGSGTTCAVAEKMGRRWVGIDAGKLAVYTAQKRLLSLKKDIGNKGKPLEAKTFALHNSGHYDFSKLAQLDRPKWRFFALQLFECSDERHTVGGVKCDGRKRGHSVLVFDHHAHPEDSIDEDFIDDLHLRIGKKVGSRFYIIAKKASFDFQEDYLEKDGVRYYALRIPYSFIEELHKTKFSNLRQPVADGVLNALQEAVGFDFIEIPDVEFQVGCLQPITSTIAYSIVDTKEFSSRAKTRNGQTITGLDSLAMILIDFDYNGKTFDFDKAFYGTDLKAAKPQGRVIWPFHLTGERVAVIWVDIHGNESFQVVARDEFENNVVQEFEVSN